MNNYCFTARLCKDPELVYTRNDKAVTNLYVAINDFRNDDAVFIEVTVWGKTAESCSEFLSKGDEVSVVGYLKRETWGNDDGGQEKEKIKVVAQTVDFPSRDNSKSRGSRRQGRSRQQSRSPKRKQRSSRRSQARAGERLGAVDPRENLDDVVVDEDEKDDIPF